jgi:hypothetical protein
MQADLPQVERQIENLLSAIENMGLSPSLKEKWKCDTLDKMEGIEGVEMSTWLQSPQLIFVSHWGIVQRQNRSLWSY